ncbi:terpene synthase family protein [Herbidospora mongoliensis]|uniref:terpene synthase family protein n=1 Tax=Herbidospora mongoliensis TaxID=688067 RepID=UPI000835D012|nr:terpene synthase family protein [Herbidospora mongoliensis]
MTPELRIPSAAAVLAPLVYALPPTAGEPVECDTRALGAWAGLYGLSIAARPERLAARVLPGNELLARWVTWQLAYDDWCDEGSGSRDTTVLDLMQGRLRDAAHAGHRTEEPLVAAFADLWRVTAPDMSPAWEQRFTARMEAQAQACRMQAVNRSIGRVPSAGEYPALRRDVFAGAGAEIIEGCLRIEVPGRLHATPPWRTLLDAVVDVTAWCNDVASLGKERGDPHNYLRVAASRIGVPAPAEWVADRIVERAEDLTDAAKALPEAYAELGVPDEVEKVASSLFGVPRAYLEWLLESPRYQ